ncbi:MAG: hypothetical protein Q9196_002305, partial [Gyalolechia fulgens]
LLRLVKPSNSILIGARRTHLWATMRRGSLDEQTLWDSTQLKEVRSFADVGALQGLPTAVTTDIEGGVKLPKGSKGEDALPEPGKARDIARREDGPNTGR